MNTIKVREALKQFILEDIGDRDETSESIFSKSAGSVTAEIVAKDAGVFSGEQVLHTYFTLFDHEINITSSKTEGQFIEKGDVLATLEGNVYTLLQGERVLLNVLQRMCGIASTVHLAKERLNDPSIRLCDTRKTAPGLRMFDKAACRAGGGYNHRNGLHDAVMLKENHIAACGSISKAVRRVKAIAGPMMKIEVETTNAEEVKEAVAAAADVIMFDNASPDEIRTYQKLVPPSIRTEASGGIDLSTIHLYAGTGVDFLSLGFITHSVKALDLSMLLKRG
ncbi:MULTISPECIES: carboxylating nicotinate-nucleotide diphosphorylase [Bacillaceae]|uniref:Probable nicotinate-nucleotide pyrophosphorylase [carboxylating] n=2 Tax=Bacillaceae TaxID=186817 RepID=A0A9D5DL16_9BACI|nr:MULTISPECIES: carboxylating nicotinate-nucleotide diphosphorylase [Bacillaceae]KQL55885.1 nicotinate-nucleotide pyrophosphorylase [Alkalicoccobacillus plakortidis]RQW19799.1 carboxylating nicotinate-nucleotide diphosphorylase [Bacillus sp. C1-1]TES47985.1 carboxylating nicotinate-nucleotide diphosphorylase [Shouchella lehensis]